jgi:hypothetical protein
MENNPQRVDKSERFHTQRAVIVLLYFCQCFIGYRGTIGLFPGSANFGKTSQLFYYHITTLIQLKYNNKTCCISNHSCVNK